MLNITALSILNQAVPLVEEVPNLPYGQALILFLVLLLILAFALLWNRARLQPPAIHVHAGPDHAEPVHAVPDEADDLTIIEGIGPKTATVFQQAGISTFVQLAETDSSELNRILESAGLHLGNPATWPEQARLAAAGNWEALEALQASLKGGRRR